MQEKLNELKRRLIEVNDLDSAAALLSWDQNTYMPSGGAEARGRQMATLAQLSQEKLTDPAIGKLLDDLCPYEESQGYDSDDASLVRVARRNYERSVKIPPALIGEMANHQAQSFSAWAKARPANDFKAVQPYLEKTVELSRRIADCFPGYTSIADPLIAYADYGMTAASVQAIFASLRNALVPVVQAILANPPADDTCLRSSFPEGRQQGFGIEVVRRIGFDFNRGRLDKSPHPFTTKFAQGDVRITTRYQGKYLGESLFSTMHEAGHAMYEQGINQAYAATPLDNGTSSGVHESQSRLWENRVGRSRAFWKFFYPRLQKFFPSQLGNVSLDTFYRAINKVSRSLIRTDADEVTYNLHVMLRFDFELALLEGKLAVRDLPEAWNARFKEDFGITPPHDRDGVLQDVHWYAGLVGGAFQGYTLGNILGAQFYKSALQAHPEIPTEMEQGKFDVLRGWLKENIYQYGSKYTAAELVQRICSGSIAIEPYMDYLKKKYGALYKL